MRLRLIAALGFVTILMSSRTASATALVYTFTASVNAVKETVSAPDFSTRPPDEVAQALYDYWLPGFDTGTYEISGTLNYDVTDRAATSASVIINGYAFQFLDFLAFNATGDRVAMTMSGGVPKPNIPNASAFLGKDSTLIVTNPSGDPAIVPTTLEGFDRGTLRWAGQGWTGPTFPDGPNFGQTYVT